MTRAILIFGGILAIVLIGHDLYSAATFAGEQNVADQVIGYYEDRLGQLLDMDARNEVYNNAMQACHYLDTNPSLPDLWLAMTDGGYISGDAAATTIEAAATYLCPEHKGLLL
jgi:hypothetical protein